MKASGLTTKDKIIGICLGIGCFFLVLALSFLLDHLDRQSANSYDAHLATAYKFHEAMHEAKMPHSHPMPARRRGQNGTALQ